MVRWQIATDDDRTCNIYREWRLSIIDREEGGFLRAGFEAIPQNLCINISCGIILFLLFALYRKPLWDFGRIAVMHRNEPRFREVISQRYPAKKPLFQIIPDNRDWQYAPSQDRPKPRTEPEYQDENLGDDGPFDFIWITWALTDEQIAYRSGLDAVHYLEYQRHLLLILLLMNMLAMFIILPIHLMGRHLRKENTAGSYSFQETTISNINPDSPVIWVHVTVSFLYFVISMVIMRNFSKSIEPQDEDELRDRTVLIAGINRNLCYIERVQSHFEEIYPHCTVEEVSFVYDTSRLRGYEESKSSELCSIKRFQAILEKTGRRERVHPACCCGKFCFLCCKRKVDAIQHYIYNIRWYRRQADYERIRSLNAPLGLAFVTFSSEDTAIKARWHYHHFHKYLPFPRLPVSRFSRKMQTERWIAMAAPCPNDVIWENFGLTVLGWYLKFGVINFAIIVIACIFSTPIIFLKSLELILQLQARNRVISTTRTDDSLDLWTLFHDVLPIFLIWVFAVSLPSMVTVSDRAIGFWSRSAENRSRMIKTFTFLIAMVVILPSLGISTLLYFVDAGRHRIKLECLFSPSNGAFYINYVSTSCFIGSLADLCRFPELFVFVWRWMAAKSHADIAAVRYFCTWDYQMGTQYAWLMVVFAVVTIFSMVCPLILPFGLIYHLLKYFIDKYNVFFAYGPCKVDRSVHLTAINFVTVPMFILQSIMLAYVNRVVDRDIHTEDKPLLFAGGIPYSAVVYYEYFLYFLAIVMFIAQIGFGAITSFTRDSMQENVCEPLDPPWLNVKSREANISTYDYYKKWKVEYPDIPLDYVYRIPKVLEINQRRFFATIPRTIVTPDGMYWPPYLRKDFPFQFPARKFNMPKHHSYIIERRLDERRSQRQEQFLQRKQAIGELFPERSARVESVEAAINRRKSRNIGYRPDYDRKNR